MVSPEGLVLEQEGLMGMDDYQILPDVLPGFEG